jgi:YVTN family beta-propeller protein
LFVLPALAVFISSCTADDQTDIHTPVSGSSIVLGRDGSSLFIANGDADTVSIVNVKDRKLVKEIAVGKEPRELTASKDGKTLYVTCRYANSVEWIDTRSGKVVGMLKTGIEPYGIVASPDGKRLYVSNYRSSTISVIDAATKKSLQTIPVGEKPRALSLSADGLKLYVAHYLSGDISAIDTRDYAVTAGIKLSPSPDVKDRKKSQGAPNALEQIRITPDGKQAWVAHQLTNTDTKIQFEETVFPALSLVNLEMGKELPKERKELFDALDVKDKFGKTTIVSGPMDIAFSPDGQYAYELMGGSEDLVVYDLKRGGRAVQIVRRLPGDYPIGMAVSDNGTEMYVHNANSHDVVYVKLPSADGPAQAKVDGKPLPVIGDDPLSPLVRKGKTAFYSANSDEFPLTGNNWMSCATCHADGEADGMTLLTAKGPRNVPSNVLAMETGLFLWDGSRDDFYDYIHTVQDEMGGFDGIDPGKPLPEETKQLMDEIAAYLKDASSFPVPQSPYRDADGSMTVEAEAGQKLFEGKAGCIACHAGDALTDSGEAKDKAGVLTTDNTDHLYDVGTSGALDADSKGDARAGFTNPRLKAYFDVPTLRGVWTTAPYLHDGSAAALEDVLKRAGNKHGNTEELTADEIKSIVAYLKQIQ